MENCLSSNISLSEEDGQWLSGSWRARAEGCGLRLMDVVGSEGEKMPQKPQ